MIMSRVPGAAIPVAILFCGYIFGGESRTVFPGAQGFGVETEAGRGGQIVRVTNLNSEGPGSFREAVEVKGPRIVVFEVGGVIDLNKKTVRIQEPFLTVAGQTAPSPGITLIRGGVSISTHDVLVQHIRIRTGDAGEPRKSGYEPDGLATAAAYNVVIDRCSFSWAVDESLSASGPRHAGPEGTSRRITFSNNIIAEALHDSSHSKGPHSMGSLIHDHCTDIAVIGNFYAHNNHRNPYFKAFTTGVIANNLIYNPGTAAIAVNWPQSEWEPGITPQNARVSVVGNVLIHGANTVRGLALVGRKGDVYLEDNWAQDAEGRQVDLVAGDVRILLEKPSWPRGFQVLPSGRVVEHAIHRAGARAKDRDEVDRRIIREFQERKGRIINSQEEVGGYPRVSMTKHRLEVPEKNIDQWLAELAAKIE